MSLFWNEPRDSAELVGHYVANRELVNETLTLNSDGTYSQRVKLKASGKVDTASGTWTFDSQNAYVTFDQHMMLVASSSKRFNPDYAKPRSDGLVSLPVDRLFGEIRIGAADDAIPYRKE